MKKRKPRKPKGIMIDDIRFIADTHTDYIWLANGYRRAVEMKDIKKIHTWLTEVITWMEARARARAREVRSDHTGRT